jgi:large-conductance mechanosensitive channel
MVWSTGQKWLLSLIYGLLFLIIASPFMYKLTGTLTNMISFKTSENGCPNIYGLILHSVVFFLLARLIMFIVYLKYNNDSSSVQQNALKNKIKR